MNDLQSMKILETQCGVPPATMSTVGGPVQYNRSRHRHLAESTSEYALTALQWSQAWSTGVPSERELRQYVRRQMVGSVGLIVYLLWAWRIASWIRAIRDAWDRTGVVSEGEGGPRP